MKKRLLTEMVFESLFENTPTSFFLILVIFVAVLVSNSILYDNFIHCFYSYAQQVEKNPGFQDSYWTDKTVAAGNDSNKLEEKEVGPGEGIATLAIVLVNKAQTDISAIKGYLSLPDEFEALKRENITDNITSSHDINLSNVAVASYDSIVNPGQEFTLYFDIYIKTDAIVGSYYSYLDLAYSKVLTAGDIIVKDIPISFRIPGKEILDVEAKNQYLSPATINKVGINIINKGSADANNAIITISNDVDNAEGSLASLSESSSAESIKPSNSTTSNNNTNTTLSTLAANDQTDDNVTSSSITTFGTLKYNVGNIGPNEVVSINPLIYPSSSAAGTLQNLNIQISYGNSIGNRETVDYNLGLVIKAEPTESNFNVYFGDDEAGSGVDLVQSEFDNKVSNNSIITAGSIEEMIFAIKKSSTQPNIQDVVISLQPSSESAKVLGPSRWSFETIEDNTLLNTTLFVSEELIGKPVQLNFNIDYLLDGIAKSETLDVGLYVDGKIAVRAYDFEINIIGDEPNLVANLLNEGNTDAFFTTAEMVSSSLTNMENSTFVFHNENNSIIGNLVEEYPPLQYLGDLAENSPLPVSIPLKIPNNTNPGNYPVFLKISYKDNLRNDHSLVVNGTVNYSPQIESSSSNSGLILGFINPVMLLLLLLVVVIVLYFIIRRFQKKKKEKKMKSSVDSEKVGNDLDSVLGNSD